MKYLSRSSQWIRFTGGFCHAVPMPVVVKTRQYRPELYKAIGYIDDDAARKKREQDKAAIWEER
jgi:hypothetical protein